MNLKDTYDAIAEDWHRNHQQDEWWVEGTNHLISLLPKGALVLDAGCGGGFKSKYLAERGLNVLGIDFSEKMIAIAKREVPEAHFQMLDMYELDSLKEKFNCIFAQASLLHIPKKDFQEIIAQIKSVLKENGLLYIAVKGIRTDKNEEEIAIDNDIGYEYQRFFSYYSLPEIETTLEKEDFEMVYTNVSKVGKTDWIQVIGKKLGK